MMKLASVLMLLPLVAGCTVLSALDFGGVEKEPFEFRLGTDHGVHQAAADTKPGAVDSNGVYQPETKQTDAILSFPNVHAGMMVEVRPKAHLTPVVQLEACSTKAPYIGWWELQVGAGANVAEVYIGKRLLSIWEITVGPCFLRDFDEHKWGFGGVGTIIKF